MAADRLSADVVIIGGGVMGSAVACFLGHDPAFTGRVLVVERDAGYARASSALSAGSIRQQFSTPANIRMSQFGFALLSDPAPWLTVDGEVPDLGLVRRAYLILAGAGNGADDAAGAAGAHLAAVHAAQAEAGARALLLDPAAMAARFPWLNTDGLAGGTLGLDGEGWFDGWALLQALKRRARAAGAVYIEDRVTGLELSGPADGPRRVTDVRLASGGRIAAGQVVNAAGPFAADIAAMAGIDLPVRPRCRSVFVFDCAHGPHDAPLVVDPTGVYMRPEGDRFICGWSPGAGDADPDSPELTVDHSQFEDRIWPALAARIPAFERLRPGASWAGHYEMNVFDANALIGAVPAVPNLFMINGFSGHGLQQAPAAGRGVAELITHGRFTSLDLGQFTPERVAAGARLVELAVI